MRRRTRLVTIFAAVALSVTMGLPATASEGPKHTSCQAFGQFFSAWAQGGAEEAGFKNGGQGIKSTAHNGLFIEGMIDAEPPGSVAQVVRWEHSLFCEGA